MCGIYHGMADTITFIVRRGRRSVIATRAKSGLMCRVCGTGSGYVNGMIFVPNVPGRKDASLSAAATRDL